MNIVIEAAGFIDYKCPTQGIKDIKNSGFDNTTLIVSHSFELKEKQKYDELFEEYLKNGFSIADICQNVADVLHSQNLNVSFVRSPVLSHDCQKHELNEAQRLMSVETLRFCHSIGSKYVLISPIECGISKSDIMNENYLYYLSLAKEAVKNNVKILLENNIRYYNGQIIRGIFSDETETAKFIDMLNKAANNKVFEFAMNTARCSLCGTDMQNFVVTMGKRISTVIIADCDGHNEEYLLPFTSINGGTQTDWLSLIRGLRDSGFNGDIVIDASRTASAFSPLLRPQLLKFTKAVADYFKWQLEIEFLLKKYEKRVLFGAGNMCRNYMKCYGEKYPPLFTCDNNSKIWGKMFCGLEVKSPEELKKIPADCAVFICNIYYREIEQQLRDMKITNPIEYFNDEYMPSFYFDRLKGV